MKYGLKVNQIFKQISGADYCEIHIMGLVDCILKPSNLGALQNLFSSYLQKRLYDGISIFLLKFISIGVGLVMILMRIVFLPATASVV